MRWSPAAPISPRARLVNSRRRSGCARLGLQVGAQASRRRHLVLPGDVEREPILAEQLLLGLTLVGAGDVCGRHRDQVPGRAGLDHGGGHPGRPEHVDLDRLGQGGVEGHGGGGVDDDVSCGERRPAPVVQPEPVASDVAGARPAPGGSPRR